jgi:hypothetical protein
MGRLEVLVGVVHGVDRVGRRPGQADGQHGRTDQRRALQVAVVPGQVKRVAGAQQAGGASRYQQRRRGVAVRRTPRRLSSRDPARLAPKAGVYLAHNKGNGSQNSQRKSAFRLLCSLALLCGGDLLGGPAELFGGALAGFLSHLKLRLHFLKIATAPGEILFDSAEGFTVLLQASLQPLLCLRSLIQSMLRTVE